MTNRIVLNDENITKLKPGNLVAITIAEGGAMGDPGAIELVDKELKIYHTHFGETKKEDLERVIPFLKTLEGGFGEISGLSKDWDFLYTGYGNYLFIRPEFKDGILEYVRKKYKDTKMPEVVELYSHWYEALEKIIKDRKK